MVLWWDQIGDGKTVSLTSHFFWGAATEVIEHVGHGGSAEEKSLWAQLAARLHLNLTCETFNIFQLFCWFAPSIETCLWGEHRSCKWLASTSLCRWPWGTRSGGLVIMVGGIGGIRWCFKGWSVWSLMYFAWQIQTCRIFPKSESLMAQCQMLTGKGKDWAGYFWCLPPGLNVWCFAFFWELDAFKALSFSNRWIRFNQDVELSGVFGWLVTSSNYQVNPVFDWHVWGFPGAGVTELDAPWLQSFPVAGLWYL